jgi:hypothetical protein
MKAGPAAQGIALEGLEFENIGSLFSQQHTGVWPGDALGNFKNPYSDECAWPSVFLNHHTLLPTI